MGDPMLTREDLQKFAPRPASGTMAKTWDSYVDALIENAGALCAEFGIDTPLELQHFLAQIAHESGGFTIIWESGAYSATGIMNIFGVGKHSARVTTEEAHKIASLPLPQRAEVLFERVYGLGNPSKARELGNTDPGDGYKYRGFGPMQITGKADHMRLLMGDHSFRGALRGAFAEWGEKNCNELAARDDIKSITKRINGGYNGLESRKKYLRKAKTVWPLFPGADEPTVTKDEIVNLSTKASTANTILNTGKVIATTAVVAEAADPLAKATEQITLVNTLTSALATFGTFLKANALLGIILMALLLWWFGRDMIKKIIADFEAGRYFPSGGVPDQSTEEPKS